VNIGRFVLDMNTCLTFHWPIHLSTNSGFSILTTGLALILGTCIPGRITIQDDVHRFEENVILICFGFELFKFSLLFY